MPRGVGSNKLANCSAASYQTRYCCLAIGQGNMHAPQRAILWLPQQTEWNCRLLARLFQYTRRSKNAAAPPKSTGNRVQLSCPIDIKEGCRYISYSSEMTRGRSEAGLSRWPVKPEIAGSSPVAPDSARRACAQARICGVPLTSGSKPVRCATGFFLVQERGWHLCCFIAGAVGPLRLLDCLYAVLMLLRGRISRFAVSQSINFGL